MNIRHVISTMLYVLLFCLGSSSIEAQLPQSEIFDISWSRDNSRIAITTREGLFIYDHSLNLIASQSFPIDIYFYVPYSSLSPDGTRIYVGSQNNRGIFDTATLQLLVDMQNADLLSYTAQWNSQGSEIAFRRRDDFATVIYDATTGNLLRSFSTGLWRIGWMNFEGYPLWSPDDAYFAGVIGDNQVIIFDSFTGELFQRYQIADSISNLQWSPDASRIALVAWTRVPVGSANSFPLAPDMDQVAVRREVIIIDAMNGNIVSSTSGIRDDILRLQWHPDGTELAGWDGFRRLYVWDSTTGDLVDSYVTLEYYLKVLQYSRYGGRLVLAYTFDRPAPLRVDDVFIPLSTYAPSTMDSTIQFIAPLASPIRLQAILSRCASDLGVISVGNELIETNQHSQFIKWLELQPDSAIPAVCADDLRLIIETYQSR